jgi:hypothetical protein
MSGTTSPGPSTLAATLAEHLAVTQLDPTTRQILKRLLQAPFKAVA